MYAALLTGTNLRSPGVIEYVAPAVLHERTEEAGGKGLKAIVGIVAAIAIPVAAPWLASTMGLSGAVSGMFGAAARTISSLGSAVASGLVGGALGAAAAYAQGARGGDIWRAAGFAAIGSGIGGWARGASAGAPTGASVPGTGSAPPTQPAGLLTGSGGSAVNLGSAGADTISSVAASGANTGAGVQSAIQAAGAGPQTASALQKAMTVIRGVDPQRLLALASMGNQYANYAGMEELVRARQAELAQIQQQDVAAYNRIVQNAQMVLNEAQRLDPHWLATLAVADSKGQNSEQTEAALRETAMSQGGAASTGRLNATRRQAGLAAARNDTLAYSSTYARVAPQRVSAIATAAGLFPTSGPPHAAQDEAYNNNVELNTAKQERNASVLQAAGLFLTPRGSSDGFDSGLPKPNQQNFNWT